MNKLLIDAMPWMNLIGMIWVKENQGEKQLLDGEQANGSLLTGVGAVVTCGVVSVDWGGAGGNLGL